ncbi:carbon storage regulator [Pseudomonadota bacterium]|jgi:carbon storage regulator
MLLLKRTIGEKFRIGENVTVTVLGFKGNQIRIGIKAPLDVQVDREEWLLNDAAEPRLACRQGFG